MNIRTETITKITPPKHHIHILTTYFPCITDAWFWAYKMCQNLAKLSDVVILKHGSDKYYVGKVMTERDYSVKCYQVELANHRVKDGTLIEMLRGRYTNTVGRGGSQMPDQVYTVKPDDEIWKANI